jgi:hypothetical protein
MKLWMWTKFRIDGDFITFFQNPAKQLTTFLLGAVVMNRGFSVKYGKSFLKIFAMSSRRNSTHHAYVKSSRWHTESSKYLRFLNSMIQSNTVLCIIELSYLQCSMSTDVRDPALLRAIEEFTSYMDAQRPFLTWWRHRSMVFIPMRSELPLLWNNIMYINLSSTQGRNRSTHFPPSSSQCRL